jgi:hypothetical protein
VLPLVLSFSLLSIEATDCRSIPCTVNAIAEGSDVEAAGDRLAAHGRPALWAVHDAAKKHEGAARARLFEAIGRFKSDEAEWALIVELKNGDLEARAGAIRGLGRMARAKTVTQVLGHVNVESASVRDAAAGYLLAIGEPGRGHATKLLSSSAEQQRAIGLAYALSSKDFDVSTSMFRIAELARSENADVSELAARVLAKAGGVTATGELASIVADPVTKEVAWLRSAELLTSMGTDGRRELIGAIGRVRDDAKRGRLGAIAAKGAAREEVQAMVEMLDDPSPERRSAARAILAKTGTLGREVAQAHLPRALPELEAAIRAFLASSPPDSKQLEAKAP